MNDGAKSLYGALIGAGGSGGGSTPSVTINQLELYSHYLNTIESYSSEYTNKFAYADGMTWGDFIASQFNVPITITTCETFSIAEFSTNVIFVADGTSVKAKIVYPTEEDSQPVPAIAQANVTVGGVEVLTSDLIQNASQYSAEYVIEE